MSQLRDLYPGQHYSKLKQEHQNLGKLWEDPTFVPQATEKDASKQFWKRPSDFAKNPIFISDVSNMKIDVMQGSVGDCSFLSKVLAIVERPDVIHRIIPFIQQQAFDEHYAGIFRFRFWRNGYWYEVCVDDRLLVDKRGRIYGARSRTRNEFWVSLLEKASTKFNAAAEDDKIWSKDRLKHFAKRTTGISLTGGLEHLTKFKGTDGKNEGKPQKLHFYEVDPSTESVFASLKRALDHGSIISTGISVQDRKLAAKMGLSSFHAYALTGAQNVVVDHKEYLLVRIRNPWGTSKEWNGPFSDSSPEMDELVKEHSYFTRTATTSYDGEFWMTFQDFTKYFNRIRFFHWTPAAFEKTHIDPSTETRWSNYAETFAVWPKDGEGDEVQHRLKVYPNRWKAAADATPCHVLLSQYVVHKPTHYRRPPRHGMLVYRIDSDSALPIDARFRAANKPVFDSKNKHGKELIDVIMRFQLTAGDYVVVSQLHKRGRSDRFRGKVAVLMRLFTDCPTEFGDPTGIDFSPKVSDGDEGDESTEDDRRRCVVV